MFKYFLKLDMAGTFAVTAMTVQAETIRVTLQLPESHSLGQNWLAFKKIIEKESGGELQLQLFPSAQLCNSSYPVTMIFRIVKTMQQALKNLQEGKLNLEGEGVGFDEFKEIIGFKERVESPG